MTLVGFWNIQRASNPERERFEFVGSLIEEWVNGKLDAPAPELLVLAEVTQTGESMAAWLLGFGGYEAEYIAVGGKKDRDAPSPCSFLVFGRRPLPRARPTGDASVRPMIKLRVGNVTVAALHNAARGEPAKEETLIACEENRDGASLILGDINYDLRDIGSTERREFARYRFAPQDPGMGMTFRSGKVFDYALTNPGVHAVARPPVRGYDAWDIVDHAPIAYEF